MVQDIEVVGHGNIGDKARQLMMKTLELKEIGFYVPKRVVLAEDFFDGFFQRNGLGKNLRSVPIVEDLETKIKKGSLTEEEFLTIRNISHSFGNSPLAIRSSAEGDSRGTGTYHSEFTENITEPLKESIQRVLASYFSKDAIAFRRDAKTGEGFGVIIEPIIGQDIVGCFSPVFSGFGYTSTSRGEGYVVIVPGLGGGVDTRDGERISPSTIKPFNGRLDDYIEAEIMAMFSVFHPKVKRKSSLLRTYDRSDDTYKGKAYNVQNISGQEVVFRTELLYEKAGLGSALYDINLNSLFEMMQKMEQYFGKPQYFEWAMTIEDDNPKYWIVQIADTIKRLDIMDFGDLGNILFTGHTVTGTGNRECNKIIQCSHPWDIPFLRRLNETNQGYVLIFSSNLTTEGRMQLPYSVYSNANVLLETQTAIHAREPLAHLEGEVGLAGKLFGVLDNHTDLIRRGGIFMPKQLEEEDFIVYEGKVGVIASERQNKIVVYEIN